MKAGWEVRPLGEVCDVLDRLRKPITKKDRVHGPYPYYGATGELDRVADYIFDEPLVLIGEDGAKWGAGDNSAFSVSGKVWVNNHAHVIRPIRNIISDEWLIFFLNFSDLSEFITGMTVPKLNQARMRDIPIPIPPLEEQKRIVAVLDAAFEGLTRAKENAEANLQNARELFGAFLEELFLKNGKMWSAATLQDTVTSECTLSYGIVQPGDDVEGGIPVVRPTDLRKPLIARVGLKTIASEKAAGYKRTQLIGDEILLCVRGTTGVVAKALPELEGGNVTRGIVPIRFDSEKMLQDFGYYQFLSRHIQEQIEAQTYGAALRQINIRDLRKLSFVFPEASEQETLLPMLQDAQQRCETLIEFSQAKLTDIADLRQSLLQKAFAGELT